MFVGLTTPSKPASRLHVVCTQRAMPGVDYAIMGPGEFMSSTDWASAYCKASGARAVQAFACLNCPRARKREREREERETKKKVRERVMLTLSLRLA